MSAGVRVLRPGLLTTVQDLGRPGHQHQGVPVGGAMDAPALRLANLLVGNAEGEAALEVTLLGPSLELNGDVLLCVTGADLSATLDERPLTRGRVMHARAGARLAFGRPVLGCRAYIAFAGGIDVPLVLGSRSTYLRAGIGGIQGRALAAHDYLRLGEPGERSRQLAAMLEPGRAAPWGLSLRARPSADVELRALRGRHFADLTSDSKQALFSDRPEWFVVGAESDRMGYRLEGPALELSTPVELVSEGVVFGTMQLPPGGSPIVLMADRQTTGGYPRVLEVATADLPLLAQAPPGTRVRFRETSLQAARRLYLEREQELSRLALAINLQVH